MQFDNFESLFSHSRISRYLTATNNDQDRAQKLYVANLKISQAFHPLLGVIEVALRNCINNVLSDYFNDPNWIRTQKIGFMVHSTLSYTHKRTNERRTERFLLKQVEIAEKRLRKSGTIITSGKIISEQTFGFWTEFYEVNYYKILQGRPIKAFTSLPSGTGRKEVKSELEKIRNFRNRINHNEPVCFSTNNIIDFTNTLSVYKSIKDLLSWMNPELVTFIKNIDNVKKIIKQAEEV